LFSQIYPEYSFILPVAVIFSAFSSWISYFYSSKIVLGISQAKEIQKQDNPYVYRIVENLAITAGVPTPRVYIIKDTAMNAFATGRDPKHAAIALTSGIISRLENEELEGVIAHELSHIGNYDIRISTIVVTLVGLVALMADFFLRFTWFGGERRRSNRGEGEGGAGAIILVIGLIFAILAPIAATLIQLAISRKREFLADASGALLTRYPEGLARALEKISMDQEPLEAANRATAHLYFANPLKKKSVSNLFSTHPQVEDRITALRNMERFAS
jgi:heat shock protein HtpX